MAVTGPDRSALNRLLDAARRAARGPWRKGCGSKDWGHARYEGSRSRFGSFRRTLSGSRRRQVYVQTSDLELTLGELPPVARFSQVLLFELCHDLARDTHAWPYGGCLACQVRDRSNVSFASHGAAPQCDTPSAIATCGSWPPPASRSNKHQT